MVTKVLKDLLWLILCATALVIVCVSILGTVQFVSDYSDKKASDKPKEGMVRIIYPNGESADWPKDKVKVGRY